jgi:hypothetical protein
LDAIIHCGVKSTCFSFKYCFTWSVTKSPPIAAFCIAFLTMYPSNTGTTLVLEAPESITNAVDRPAANLD